MNRPPLPKQKPKGIVSVPTSLTDLTTTDSQIFHLTVANAGGTSRTLLVTDAAGNPLIPTVTIADKTVYQFSNADGDCAYLVGGIKWQASGAGLTAEYSIRYQ